MDQRTHDPQTAMQWLERMFEVELRFVRSGSGDVAQLGTAFHPNVVVHEPRSLPYAGDWRGLDGVGALFKRMREVWSDMRVEDMTAARNGNTVFLSCALHLVARASGLAISQPFAEVLRFEDGRLIEGTPFYFDTAEINAVLGRPHAGEHGAGI